MLAPIRPSPIIPSCIRVPPAEGYSVPTENGHGLRYGTRGHGAALHRTGRNRDRRAAAGLAPAGPRRGLGGPGARPARHPRPPRLHHPESAVGSAPESAAGRAGRRRRAGRSGDGLDLAAVAGRNGSSGALPPRRLPGCAAGAGRRCPRPLHDEPVVRRPDHRADVGSLCAGHRAAVAAALRRVSGRAGPRPPRAERSGAPALVSAGGRRRGRLRRVRDLLHPAEPRQIHHLQLGPRPARQRILQRAPRSPVPVHAAHSGGELERAPRPRPVLDVRALADLRAPPRRQHAAGAAEPAARRGCDPSLPVRGAASRAPAGAPGDADVPRLPADARRAVLRFSLPAGRRPLPAGGHRRLRWQTDAALRGLLGGSARLPRRRRDRDDGAGPVSGLLWPPDARGRRDRRRLRALFPGDALCRHAGGGRLGVLRPLPRPHRPARVGLRRDRQDAGHQPALHASRAC